MSPGAPPASPSPPLSLDILVVGCGFGGIYQLHHFRKLGYSVKIFDAASNLGGIWYWNCYPGARVDSEVPNYELSIPELWKDWTWTEKYPGWMELRQYFEYVEEKLDVKKDIQFNTRVVGATWDEEQHEWLIEAQARMNPTGASTTVWVRARFLVLCVGFAAKPYIPNYKSLETFQGILHHTSQWPQAGLDLHGKRVGVIGTGASGVQVIQELGPEVSQLTVFQRTPNLALPMRQVKIDGDSVMNSKDSRTEMYEQRRKTVGGFFYDRHHRRGPEATPEERLAHLEQLWANGGLRFLHQNFYDLRMNQELNDEVYEFWRRKVRERIHDPIMQEKLAPTIPPHPIGVKRASLEQNYYEVFNQPNATLIDLEECPIAEMTPQGIKTADGTVHELDAIVMATGFDSLTGGITQIDFKGVDGGSIAEKWKNGVHSYLGMTSAGFPNMFFVYGPQAPTAFCNGPTCGEIQGDWIIDCIKYMATNQLTRIEAKVDAEEHWRQKIFELSAQGLWGKARSWYMGSNIPSKAVEPLNWAGGVQAYNELCMEKAKRGYEGFVLSGRP
ncbi:hypothetical protein D9758_015800 [Tetrapyrgos nigripes]|uniref:Cyclopentanone 1,2-monooxygenase n=1 Tax=Tetrapyrgos nigripes TaxID=182062 RepID=A0A8H5BXV5_9AGAR|nr:hypothetical protein D9758_015800 [Tetrapyrgos nigripes]